MRAKQKGAIVSTYTHRVTKRTAVIRLNKDRMMFFTTIETAPGVPETYESKDGSDVERWLDKNLAPSQELTLDWQPVIEVRIGEGGYHSREKGSHNEGVDLEAKRYWLALTPSRKEWRLLEWAKGDSSMSTALRAELRYASSEHFAIGPDAMEQDKIRFHNQGGGYGRRTPRNFKPLFELPYHESERHWLLYTPELWKGIGAVAKIIEDARETIGELLGTAKGVETLGELGAGRGTLQLGRGQ